MRTILIFAICTIVTNIRFSAQTLNSSNKIEFVLQKFEKAMVIHNKLHYQAEMLFRGFGEDSFDIRNFNIVYKINQNNKLYGYDIEISEIREDRGLLTLMLLDSILYIISERKMEISSRKLPAQIEMGSYLETLRQYFIFSEYLDPFINGSPNDITLIDSTDEYILKRNTSNVSTRKVYLNKKSFLPQKYISIINNFELGLTQTQIVNFYFDSSYDEIPLNALSLNHYLVSGFKFIEFREDTSIEIIRSKSILSQNLNLLLNYPFRISEGDTVMLKDFGEKYILLDFWLASCLPCIKALPELNELSVKYFNSGLKVIAINCFDMENSKSLTNKLVSKNITLPIFYGKQDILNTLELNTFPSYYLFSKDGSVQYIYGDINKVKKLINEIMNNK